MPLRKIKHRIRNSDYFRFRFVYLGIAVVCILSGYLIAVVSDSAHETLQDIREMESIVNSIGGAKSVEELKSKMQSDPGMMNKAGSSLIKKFKSNPLFKEKINNTLKELK